MRILVLTSGRWTSASNCLPALVAHPDIDVALVVFAEGTGTRRWPRIKRVVKKTMKIGLLGALAGRSMRAWYAGFAPEDLFDLARRLDVPLATVPRVNCDETRELFRRTGADLGLSLGNGYIAKSVFSIPQHGMINVHGEILPEYQGAASVVWAVHEGGDETGFTIHQIDRHIDTGAILYQERFPIVWRPTLRETVRENVAEINRRVPNALAEVVAAYPRYAEAARVQRGGRSFTTPTFRQYRRMQRVNRERWRASGERS